MSIFLGDRPVSVFFNGASASLPVQGVFLGGIQVFPTGTAATVPGAPTIDSAAFLSPNTLVVFYPPEDDGGSAITGYNFYFNGTLRTPDSVVPDNGELIATFEDQDYSEQTVEVSAVNAIGEGPKSDSEFVF
jgi:hypothetical protein